MHVNFVFVGKRFIRKGIPSSMRPKVWMVVSGAEARMVKFPAEYKRLVKEAPKEDVLDAIELGTSLYFSSSF